MHKMKLSLKKDIRPRLDEMAEEIIIGLKKRSRFLLNKPVYEERFPIDPKELQEYPALSRQFPNGMTRFEDRLWRDQSTDSIHRRFLYDNQHPVLFSRDQLPEARYDGGLRKNEVAPVDINMGDKILEFYHEILPQICQPGQDSDTYGEAVLEDSLNIRKLYERICGLGPYVAQAKIQDDPSLLEITDETVLRDKLTDPKRERDVMAKGLRLARKYKLPNPSVAKDIFRQIIDLTLDVEVAYIRYLQEEDHQNEGNTPTLRKEYPRVAPGWGQEPKKERNGSRGWGSSL